MLLEILKQNFLKELKAEKSRGRSDCRHRKSPQVGNVRRVRKVPVPAPPESARRPREWKR